MTVSVLDNPNLNRYEVYDDDQLAGFTDYRLTASHIAFTHTEVGDAFSGRGLAGKLVADELADARRRGLAVLPFCPYVRNVIAQHPDMYLDLVPAKHRERFELPVARPDLPGGAGIDEDGAR